MSNMATTKLLEPYLPIYLLETTLGIVHIVNYADIIFST